LEQLIVVPNAMSHGADEITGSYPRIADPAITLIRRALPEHLCLLVY